MRNWVINEVESKKESKTAGRRIYYRKEALAEETKEMNNINHPPRKKNC